MTNAGASILGILPQLLGIIVLIGLLLAVFDPATINRLIGSSSGWLGVLLASMIGSITLTRLAVALVGIAGIALLMERVLGPRDRAEIRAKVEAD